MKTFHFLLIGILFAAFGCSEDVLTSENFDTLKAARKKAEVPKIVTIPAHGQVTTFPDYTRPLLTCTPAELGITVASEGTATGHCTMTGAFIQEESTFKTTLCNVKITPEGTPVIYAETDVIVTGHNGDKKYIKTYIWIDAVTNVVTGYHEMMGGTGRFEGMSGHVDIIDGRLDPLTGSVTWKESGYMEIVVRN